MVRKRMDIQKETRVQKQTQKQNQNKRKDFAISRKENLEDCKSNWSNSFQSCNQEIKIKMGKC